MRDTALRKITAFESVDKDVGRAARSAWNPELIDLLEEIGNQKKLDQHFIFIFHIVKQVKKDLLSTFLFRHQMRQPSRLPLTNNLSCNSLFLPSTRSGNPR